MPYEPVKPLVYLNMISLFFHVFRAYLNLLVDVILRERHTADD